MQNTKYLYLVLLMVPFCIFALYGCSAQNPSTIQPATVFTFSAQPQTGIAQSVTKNPPQSDFSYGYSARDIVDKIRTLQRLQIPKNLLESYSYRLDSDFDVNTYFTVLTHLSMEPGYVLDYVYRYDWSSGAPLIYARKSNDQRFQRGELELINSGFDVRKDYYKYLEHVRTDGTKEGFFEYTLLYFLGNQFYLHWHAAYNDTRIICDYQSLVESLNSDSFNASSSYNSKEQVMTKASELEFQPRVSINENQAYVKILTFTKWGGLYENTCSISRIFPHQTTWYERTNVIKYSLNLTY